MTKGFPPIMTCSRTSLSNASILCASIMSHETRVTYSKLGVSSTRAARLRSGEMGSKAAEGRWEGIFKVGR